MPELVTVPEQTPQEFVTTRELAKYLRVSEIKLAQDRTRGHGPPYLRFGRTIRYRLVAVDAWVAAHTVRGTEHTVQAKAQ